jgi:SprT-like family
MTVPQKNAVGATPKFQRLFDHYNRRFFGGRLPRYTVVISDRFTGGRCDRLHRTIFLNPRSASGKLLLHEMAHAATNDRHGKNWQSEMQRLISLGARVKCELEGYLPKNRPIGVPQILVEFEDAAFAGVSWHDARTNIGYEYGFVDTTGAPSDRSAANLLRTKALSSWRKGWANRKREDSLREKFRDKLKEAGRATS